MPWVSNNEGMDSSEPPKLRPSTTGLAGEDFVLCRSTNFRAVPAGGGCAGARSRQTGAPLPRWQSQIRRPPPVFLSSHFFSEFPLLLLFYVAERDDKDNIYEANRLAARKPVCCVPVLGLLPQRRRQA